MFHSLIHTYIQTSTYFLCNTCTRSLCDRHMPLLMQRQINSGSVNGQWSMVTWTTIKTIGIGIIKSRHYCEILCTTLSEDVPNNVL